VIRDDQGVPVLSWRVAILPFIDQDNLYKQFHLDEAWDSPHNAKLIPLMPKLYAIDPQDRTRAGTTPYQGFSGKGTALDRTRQVRITDITDGTSNTILVVDAGEAVPWTKPVDLPFSASKPLPKLTGPFPDVFHAVFCDGAVRTIRKSVDEQTLRAAITIDGGEVIDVNQYDAPRRPAPGAGEGRGNPDHRENLELLEEARRQAELARQLRDEVERLRAARGGPPQLGEGPWREEQERLKAELQRLRAEVESLREEVARMKRGRP
jgi:hypothetical protein